MLDVAHARFAAHGYAAVTMDDVAADAGVTKPLLYAYFGNKERLYLACMERAGDAMFATVGEAVSHADSPADALRRGLHAFFAFVDEDRDAWRVLFDETLPAGGEIAERVAEHRERLLALVAQTNIARLPEQRRAEHAHRDRGDLRRAAGRRRGARALVAAHRRDARGRRRRAVDRDRRAGPARPGSRRPPTNPGRPRAHGQRTPEGA